MPIALLSTWDKSGLPDFAAALSDAGWKLLASGGTAAALEDHGLPVRRVAEITGEPEMLGGRVKTLHPAVHAALLARPTNEDLAALAERGWEPIDMVVVNLYPFEEVTSQPEVTLEQAIENIDIGGVALLRAAAKNHARVTVLCDPSDYAEALNTDEEDAFRRRMALKAFERTAAYDRAIADYLADLAGEPHPLRMTAYPTLELRYGENPHQQAAFYGSTPESTPFGAKLLQGKALSYNNLLDLESAWRAVLAFSEPAAVVVKHNSPCGVAIAGSVDEALGRAIACDPVSAFGSVIASNRPIEATFVEALGDLFVECLISPGFSDSAREALASRKNLRLLDTLGIDNPEEYELRSAGGGLLRQRFDFGDPKDTPDWKLVSERAATEDELRALRFAWRGCQGVKSNAVVLARSEKHSAFTVGIGGGQPNRVNCVRIAGEQAGKKAPGSVLASDAFFPFPDGIEAAAAMGVTAVVQPGGSRNDQMVIEAANNAGMSMYFTGVRHFRH